MASHQKLWYLQSLVLGILVPGRKPSTWQRKWSTSILHQHMTSYLLESLQLFLYHCYCCYSRSPGLTFCHKKLIPVKEFQRLRSSFIFFPFARKFFSTSNSHQPGLICATSIGHLHLQIIFVFSLESSIFSNNSNGREVFHKPFHLFIQLIFVKALQSPCFHSFTAQ